MHHDLKLDKVLVGGIMTCNEIIFWAICHLGGRMLDIEIIRNEPERVREGIAQAQ